MMIKRWALSALIAMNLLFTAASTTYTQTSGELREEFHQTYPLAGGGRVSLENINGAVRITAWDREEVRVDAVKTAYTAERLAEAEIKVDASAGSVRIKTRYPYSSNTNPATVEYTLTVPRNVRLDGIELINGALDIDGVAGEVNASSINGRVTARGLTGQTKLSVINGRLEAAFDRLDQSAKPITLSSVNGPLVLTIPSDANAEIKAGTVHGGISNDFGLPVRHGEYVGKDLAGLLGRGGARIKLDNVNGSITIRRAQDGRQLSPVTNLLSEARQEGQESVVDRDEVRREVERETERALREQNREIQRAAREAHREAERQAREIQREAQREAQEIEREAQRDVQREAQRIEREARRDADTDRDRPQRVERESKSFATSGVPRVRLETFDGHIIVRAWDKPEVMFTATKRTHDEKEMQGISIKSEQRGAELLISAEFDKAYSRETIARGGRVVSFSSGASVEFDVYVPRNTILRASSGDGRLTAEGINGEIDLHTGDGSIDVNGGRGRVRVDTGDGRIRIVDFDGEADARTGDGRITLEGAFSQLAARTGDGSISLALPAGANATIETNAESVVNDGLAVAEDAENQQRRVRRWRVGSGGKVFTLRTGDGQIILRPR